MIPFKRVAQGSRASYVKFRKYKQGDFSYTIKI